MVASLRDKLKKTREVFRLKFDDILASNKPREEILEEMAESLILADVSFKTQEKIIDSVRKKSVKSDPPDRVKTLLVEEITGILSAFKPGFVLDQPRSVIMFVGINGGGKTTSLAKLAFHFKNSGRRVLMVAGDTFRAAAREQLSIWGKKMNIPVIRGQYNADPASVVFDAMQSYKAHDFHVLLVDTAGRIHTNVNLMFELEKIKRIIAREVEGAPHEILLVLDASTGQNALAQAREFLKFSGLTGIFLTKLDGTAKGGSVLSIIDELELPIKFLGTGESEKDMLAFSPEEFANALLS